MGGKEGWEEKSNGREGWFEKTGWMKKVEKRVKRKSGDGKGKRI